MAGMVPLATRPSILLYPYDFARSAQKAVIISPLVSSEKYPGILER